MVDITDEHISRARAMARGYAHRQGLHHLADEWESAAMLALAQAAAGYENAEVPFMAWASIHIRGRIIDAHRLWVGRRNGMTPRAGSIELGELLEQVPNLEPMTHAGVEDEVDARAALHEVLELIALLPDRERLVVLGTANGQVQAELAEVLGVTESRVSQILTEAREHLARLVAGESVHEVFRRKRPGFIPGQRTGLQVELVAVDPDAPRRVRIASPQPADPSDLDASVIGGHLDHVPATPDGRPVAPHLREHAAAV